MVTHKKISKSTVTEGSSKKQGTPNAAHACNDDPSLYGVPPSFTTGVTSKNTTAPKSSSTGLNTRRDPVLPAGYKDSSFDFSSDEDDDNDRYLKHYDEPPVLPDVCVSPLF